MEWVRSKDVLSRMRDVLICDICKDTVVNPVTYGECHHWFCSECIEEHPGGTCPANLCNAAAEVKSIKPHKTIDSLTKSLAKISQIFGDQVPDRMKRHLSQYQSDDESDQVLQQINSNSNQDVKRIKVAESKESKSPRSDIFDEDDVENLETQYVKATSTKSKKTSASLKKNKARTAGRNVSDDNKNTKNTTDQTNRDKNTKATPRVKKAVEASKSKAEPPAKFATAETSHLKPRQTDSRMTNKVVDSRKKPTATERRNKKGETVLHQAAVREDVSSVTRMLKEGANPNTVDFAGWSPLHEAAAAGNTAMVSLLLNHGASPNIHSKDLNITPLHDAVENGFADIVRLLISHGADTRAKNSTGQTPCDLPTSDSVKEALRNTVCAMTESESMDQSVIQDDLNNVESVVLACPEVSDSEWKKICSAANFLGMKKPMRSINENTTHCLLDNGKQLNVLSCQVVGALPLQDEWIFQCRELGTLVDTEPFIFNHPDITPEARHRSRDCRSRGQPKLLSGLHFYLAGGFDAQNPSKAELVKLINLAGAKMVNREPNPESLPFTEKTVAHHADDNSSLVATSHIILYQEGGKREPLMKYKMAHVKTLPVAWLTESVLQHALLEPGLFVP